MKTQRQGHIQSVNLQKKNVETGMSVRMMWNIEVVGKIHVEFLTDT
jgi:hypothetical protein